MSEATQVPAAPTESHGPLWLALRVIDEPGRVFQELSIRPRALVPILFVILASIAVAFGIPSDVLKTATEQQFAAAEQRNPGGIPPEAKERLIQRSTSPVGRGFVAGVAIVGGVVGLAITSLVLMLIFNAVSGTGIRFKEEWAIATHAYLPQTIGAFVALIAIVQLKDPTFRVSLGFMVSEESSRFLHAFANQVTFFGAWNVYLLALGNQIRTRDRSIVGPLAIVGGLWLAVNLVGAGMASFFGAMVR